MPQALWGYMIMQEDVQLVGDWVRALNGNVRDRRLRVGTWNISVSVNKAKLVGRESSAFYIGSMYMPTDCTTHDIT